MIEIFVIEGGSHIGSPRMREIVAIVNYLIVFTKEGYETRNKVTRSINQHPRLMKLLSRSSIYHSSDYYD